MANDVRRPLLITVLAILYALATILFVLGGVSMLALSGTEITDILSGDALTEMMKLLDNMNITWSQFTQGGGIAMLVLGLIYLIVTIGFFKGWKIMWYLGIIVNLLSLVGNIYLLTQAVTTAVVFSLLFSVLLLLYLTTGGVRRFFGVSS